MIDTKAIRAAAEAAPKSRFRVCHSFGPFYSLLGAGDYFHGRVRGKERADFIATANPSAVIALLDRLEAAEKDAARIRNEVLEEAAVKCEQLEIDEWKPNGHECATQIRRMKK